MKVTQLSPEKGKNEKSKEEGRREGGKEGRGRAERRKEGGRIEEVRKEEERKKEGRREEEGRQCVSWSLRCGLRVSSLVGGLLEACTGEALESVENQSEEGRPLGTWCILLRGMLCLVPSLTSQLPTRPHMTQVGAEVS